MSERVAYRETLYRLNKEQDEGGVHSRLRSVHFDVHLLKVTVAS